MDSADELADRDARSSAASDPELLCTLASGSFFSDAEIRLSRGGASVRRSGSFPAVSGDLPDRDVADLIRLPAGTEFPDISCEAVFEPAEWQSVYQIVKRDPPPKQPPTLREMVRLVAQLGGYVNRKREDEPGPQTVWLGLQRLHDIALCWQVFGPGAKDTPVNAPPPAGFV
jgi:hypothetical protein